MILVTGGFASDRSPGSLLLQHRPELQHFAATAGAFSTGDGIVLDQALGAGMVDMDKVQIHPTGFVNPADPNNPTKVLAAEVLRGVGGILLNRKGERFCYELGLRSYVMEQMMLQQQHTSLREETNAIPIFPLILSSAAAAQAQKHMDFYMQKGLLKRIDGVSNLGALLGVPSSVLVTTLTVYRQAAQNNGTDQFGKAAFPGLPSNNLETEVLYIGEVTPVLHYCMGGLAIDERGRVLNERSKDIIPGLFVAGEVSGGVHGVNRLGGNSLLECTVFGTIVGENIPINRDRTAAVTATMSSNTDKPTKFNKAKTPQLRTIALSELAQHNTTLLMIAGLQSTTDTFDIIHNKRVLEEFELEKIGSFAKEG